MNTLPPEIKECIFGFLKSEILDNVVAKVCIEWAQIAGKILDTRVEKMLTYLNNSNLDFKSRMHPTILDNNRGLLIEYENAFVHSQFEIQTHRHRGAETVFANICRARGCDCQYLDECLFRAIGFMECHQLMIAQNPEKMTFYRLPRLRNKLQNDDQELEEFSTSVAGSSDLKNVWIDNNRHTAFSIYKDLIVSQETTRVLILFRVAEVNHDAKHIVLENVRRIYLPFWCSALVMLEDKVCAFFTTGRVGIWRRSADEISVSGNTCASLDVIRAMQFSRMYRTNNLVFVKIAADVTDNGDEVARVQWAVFDSNSCEEGFQIHSLPSLNELVDTHFLDKESTKCYEILDIFVTLNAMVFYCKVRSTPGLQCSSPNSSAASSINFHTSKVLLIRRIKKSPTLQDFTDPSQFGELFYDNEHPVVQKTVTTTCFNGSVTVPIYKHCQSQRDEDYAFNMLGLQRFINRPEMFDNNELMKLNVVSFDIVNV